MCLQTQSKILDSDTCFSYSVNIGALLVQENNNQYIYRWIHESKSFCLASLQIQSENSEIYTRVIIQKNVIVICSEFVENFVAVQIWQLKNSIFVRDQMIWMKFSQIGKVIKLISLIKKRFCLATDIELRLFDTNDINDTSSTILINRDYILKDIIYNVESERLIAVSSKNEFVRYMIIFENNVESNLKVKIKGLQQVILDPLGQWCSLNHESVLQVFEENKQLAKIQLEDNGQLCNFSMFHEVIVAIAKADGNILGYSVSYCTNNNKDITQLDPEWQVGCGQSDDETRWKVHDVKNFKSRVVYVQREHTFSVCRKYEDERQILFGYNRCALAK